MAAHPHRSFAAHHASTVANEIIEAGVLAGLVGGVAMALFATSYAAIVGLGFWTPVKAIAATALGDHMLQMGTPSTVLVGIAIHLAVSMAVGVLFALLMPREVAPAPALAFGAFGGVAILVAMNLAILPIVNPQMRSHLMWGSAPGTIPVVIAFAMHIIYGAGLSLAAPLRRHFNAT